VANRYDVFLSYSGRDRPAVEQIARRLKVAGLEPFYDRWCLTSGGRWQQELGEALKTCASCAVFIGPLDLGAWEQQELSFALDRAAKDTDFRVFPVLLPRVPDTFGPDDLPPFLVGRNWVDLRTGYAQSLQSLIHAVRGVAPGPGPEPHRSERKVVSVLALGFVQIGGGAASDPEDLAAALAPYQSKIRDEIERFGGKVERFVGDTVIAVFGVPATHEDDPERAVRAGLEIAEAVAELNHHDPRLELSIRAAVKTGEVLVQISSDPSAAEGGIVGDVVNTASRLQLAAPIGAVLAGDTTHRATTNVITYESLPPIALEGKLNPVPRWRALSARSRFGVDLDLRPKTPFIGRSHELDLLTGAFKRALTEPSTQLVTVMGEPGAGKSRLVTELSRS